MDADLGEDIQLDADLEHIGDIVGGIDMPKMTFQWFFDMSTTPGEMQKITVKAGGTDIVKRLSPQFAAYKYFKLGKIKLTMTPASTLPVDPTGLSYEAGENTVDPRDQLTPGLVRITNGECIGPLPDFASGSEAIHKFYNQMILDRRWFKWSMQSGLKKSAIPLFWSVGMKKQFPYPGSMLNIPIKYDIEVEQPTESGIHTGWTAVQGSLVVDGQGSETKTRTDYTNYNDATDYGIFQLGHNMRMGWLPTDVCVNSQKRDQPSLADVPSVDCFTILLPPAYKTKYFFRCYVTETVFFKEPVTNYFVEGLDSDGTMLYQSIDRFVAPGEVQQNMPGTVNVAASPRIELNK